MSKKSGVIIENWGPLVVDIDREVKELWGELEQESLEEIKKNINVPSVKGLMIDDFMHMLERVGRLWERRPDRCQERR
jgi:hypothetical protein